MSYSNIRLRAYFSVSVLQACSLKLDRAVIKTDSLFVVKVINSWLGKWRANEWKKADGKMVENVDDIKKLDRYLEMIKVFANIPPFFFLSFRHFFAFVNTLHQLSTLFCHCVSLHFMST